MTDVTVRDAPAENIVVHGADLPDRLDVTLDLVRRLVNNGRQVYVFAKHSEGRFHDIVGTARVRGINALAAFWVREMLYSHYADGNRVAVVFFGLEAPSSSAVGCRNRPLNRLLRDPDITVVTVSSEAQIAKDHRYSVKLLGPAFKTARIGDPKGYTAAFFEEESGDVSAPDVVESIVVPPPPLTQTWFQWAGLS